MFLKSNILESRDINENMNHTTQSLIFVSMLAALTIGGISIVTSMQAQAASQRSSEEEDNAAKGINLCATNNSEKTTSNSESITSNPCKPAEADQQDKAAKDINLCATKDIGDQAITSNPCKPAEADEEEEDTSSNSQ
jgi:predicted lipoprotein with Yx(FWY)xxD motif